MIKRTTGYSQRGSRNIPLCLAFHIKGHWHCFVSRNITHSSSHATVLQIIAQEITKETLYRDLSCRYYAAEEIYCV